MNPNKLLLPGIILLIVFLAVGCSNGKYDGPSTKPIPVTAQKYEPKSTGSTEQGNVLVEATPKGIVGGKFVVEVSLNTHSVDLGAVDLAGNVVLVAGGKEFPPVDVPTLSGHHSSGEIVFDMAQEPESFSITITGVPSVEKREFKWA